MLWERIGMHVIKIHGYVERLFKFLPLIMSFDLNNGMVLVLSLSTLYVVKIYIFQR